VKSSSAFKAADSASWPKKVETQADLQEARMLGYSFFPGSFFCKPAMGVTRDIPGNKLNFLRILEAIAPENFSHDEVETLLKNDPSIIYKLPRYLNSPLLGLRGVRDAICAPWRHRIPSLGFHRGHRGHGRRQTARAHPHRADSRLLL